MTSPAEATLQRIPLVMDWKHRIRVYAGSLALIRKSCGVVGSSARCKSCFIVFFSLVFTPLAVQSAGPPTPDPDQAAAYAKPAPKTVIDLQQFRQATTGMARDGAGHSGSVELINLNPHANAWFLLKLKLAGSRASGDYHLENPRPHRHKIQLAADFPEGILISEGDKKSRCVLWTNDELLRARSSGLPFAPLCGGRLYLRNPTAGSRSRLESVTDFLRDNVWGGEQIIGFVRRGFFQDAFLEKGAPAAGSPCSAKAPNAPLPARVADGYRERGITPENLGIELVNREKTMILGCWYPVAGIPGVYVSAFQAKAVPGDILAGHRDRVRNLDAVESGALDYLVAFDLDAFELHFELGTDHPRLDWSGRAGAGVRNSRLPGPDGINKATPLVNTGIVPPQFAGETVAAFTGGFKRTHSAFRYGDLAKRNYASHYGFIVNGTVFSKLQPGLSTLLVRDDGSVDLKTWTEQDNRMLGLIRHARQNGVPVVERDASSGDPVPGRLVAQWGAGNWSGSAEGKLRSLRAGACLQPTPGPDFLVYGYFSSATPSAMARVFQAYACSEAMHLDMNALEHTYLAVYGRHQDRVSVQHLVTGMNVLDKQSRGEWIPRFLGFPDNRDFFYLVRRGSSR